MPGQGPGDQHPGLWQAASGFSVPHLLALGGREGSQVGNINLEIKRGGAATSRGRLCVIEGDQYYLAAFYRADAREGTQRSRWPLGASWSGLWMAVTCESTGDVRTRKPDQNFWTSRN